MNASSYGGRLPLFGSAALLTCAAGMGAVKTRKTNNHYDGTSSAHTRVIETERAVSMLLNFTVGKPTTPLCHATCCAKILLLQRHYPTQRDADDARQMPGTVGKP